MKPIKFEADKKTIFSMLLMLLSILVIYFIANFIVMEDLDENIGLKNRYGIQKTIEGYMDENKKHLQNELQKYQDIPDKNPTISLKAFLSRFGQNLKIKKIYFNSTDESKIERYFVTMQIDSPKLFYDMVEEMKKEGFIARLDYPIRFIKHGQKIDLQFFLTLYKPIFGDRHPLEPQKGVKSPKS